MKEFLQEIADLVTFTEEILNGKLHFLCSEALRTNSVKMTIITGTYHLYAGSAKEKFKVSPMFPVRVLS